MDCHPERSEACLPAGRDLMKLIMNSVDPSLRSG